MVPALRERAPAVDQARRIAPATLQEFTDAGFFKMLVPRSSGGLELDVPTFLRVGTIVGSGCPSSAWVVTLMAVHNWAVGLWSAEAQREVFGASGDGRVAMILRAEGTVVEAPGGVRLTGTWPFATGIDVATHVAVAAWGEGSDPASRPLLALITPADTMTVIDDWHVLGLRGTGSKSVSCKDLFVPGHLVRKLRLDETASDQQRYAASLRMALFTMSLAAPALGGVNQAIEAAARTMKARRLTSSTIEHGPRQVRWARANLLHDTAARLFEDVAARFWAQVVHRETSTPEASSALRLECAEVMRMCVEAVDLLMTGASASEYFDRSPLQRMFRDVHMAAAHEATDLDFAAIDYVRVRA